MRAGHRFRRENQEHVEANIKAQFASQVAVRWLGLRLQFIGVAIVTGVSFIAVVQHQYDVANAGKCLFVRVCDISCTEILQVLLVWQYHTPCQSPAY